MQWGHTWWREELQQVGFIIAIDVDWVLAVYEALQTFLSAQLRLVLPRRHAHMQCVPWRHVRAGSVATFHPCRKSKHLLSAAKKGAAKIKPSNGAEKTLALELIPLCSQRSLGGVTHVVCWSWLVKFQELKIKVAHSQNSSLPNYSVTFYYCCCLEVVYQCWVCMVQILYGEDLLLVSS